MMQLLDFSKFIGFYIHYKVVSLSYQTFKCFVFWSIVVWCGFFYVHGHFIKLKLLSLLPEMSVWAHSSKQQFQNHLERHFITF